MTRDEASEWRNPLDFDDPGAGPNEPAKGVTVGNIRAWFDEIVSLREQLRMRRLSKDNEIDRLRSALSVIADANDKVHGVPILRAMALTALATQTNG